MNNYIQYTATEDGCVYIYNVEQSKWQKICDVLTYGELPLSVVEQVRLDKEKASLLPDI
jgi:hypothetical protein